MARIVIIGAGVIGLQSSVTLAEAGHKVTVIAQHWPGDSDIEYTSPWAGAIWRSHATPDQTERCKWDVQSYNEWMHIVEKDPKKAESMGIMKCPITIYSEISGPAEPWYAQHVQGFQSMGQNESFHGAHAHSYDSIAMNPLIYLSDLRKRAEVAGVDFIKATLPTLGGLRSVVLETLDLINDRSAIVVNCTGLSAQHVCGDETMYPIRGQTLLGRFDPPLPREVLLWDSKNSVTYIVPRPGTDMFVLGGTKDAHNSDPIPTSTITYDILGRCKQLLAAKKITDVRIEIIKEQVGLRPGRKEGVRLEIEHVDLGQGKAVKVIHHYGHAGAGYQASIGSAEKVLTLVRDVVAGKP